MRNPHLNNGKKLNKKELKTIKGGVMICSTGGANGRVCAQIHPSCYEPECRSGQAELRCTDIVNNCVVFSLSCIEPKCRFDIGIPL
ncbi:bacteriocin-like protein [Chryseobacterium vietnamense]|jgi:bacteriocin-like protein|uniref:Bacteriocin-like protein n=1 Tax=Chryseobacterium vietnamense TaxID=866785 RepID=A0ACC6J607_9FLAO|nr:bacteriocin [Chryseobacterium vietnamense]MDR6458496.1 bacteriocin-like protein [Chryseobacterium vietnamense]